MTYRASISGEWIPLHLETCRQPRLEALLTGWAKLARRVVGHVGKLRDGAQKTTTFPSRIARRSCQVAEDVQDLVGHTGIGFREPAFKQRKIVFVTASR